MFEMIFKLYQIIISENIDIETMYEVFSYLKWFRRFSFLY